METIITDFGEDDLVAARILLASRTVVEDARICQGRSGDTEFQVGVGVSDAKWQRHLEKRLGWR